MGDSDVVGALVSVGPDANGNPTGWIYTNENDELEKYDASGRLISITNGAGLSQTLTYSDGTSGTTGGYVLDATGNVTTSVLPAGFLIHVVDPAGRTLQYGYDAVGRVVKVTNPLGGTYLYTYSDAISLAANLTSVTYPDGKIRTYLYGEAANVSATPNTGVSYTHALTGIVDENGNRFASWTYDAAGRATSSEHGAFGSGIDHVGMVYTAPDANGNSTTAVTDVMGVTRTYNFSTLLGVVKNTGITGQPCKGCTAAFTYDANGNVASRVDFNGNTTCYAYDQVRNLETVRVEGLPACPADLVTFVPLALTSIRKISTSWNTTYRLPSVIAEPLRITSYTYDAAGNVLTRTIQPTADATGGAGSGATVTGTPRTTTWTYNAAGQVLSADGPRTDVSDITHYTYDAQDNLVSVSNALNQVTTLGNYDANGRVGTITDPNGLVTTLAYDARGRLTSRDSGGETTAYSYDGVGNLTGVSLPSGASYTYSYDQANRLTQIADNLGNHINYTLDNAGNRTREQMYDSTATLLQTHSRVFDALNHLYQDIGAVNQTTTYTYDNNGNVLTATDPLNRVTSYYYDALNRLVSRADPAGGTVGYRYDALDQITGQWVRPTGIMMKNPLGFNYIRDGLGNINTEYNPDAGTISSTYDEAGNLLTRTDAKGQVASYTYDALNRVTAVTYTGGNATPVTISYQYDQGVNGIGHLTTITEPTGSTAYSYDQHGRLVTDLRQAHGMIYSTSYVYDAQGRLATVGYPSGRIVNYGFDSAGRISQISTSFDNVTLVLASNIAYEPFGGVKRFSYGDGLTAPVQSYTRSHDQDGRIASYTLNGKVNTLGYDAASQITSVTDPRYPTLPASYGYDPLSRLTSYSQGNIAQSYSYDADGNRSSQSLGLSSTSFSYAANSNRLTGVQGSASYSVSQDANGSTTSDLTRQYSYDLRGRLVQTVTAQGVVNYEVNALGLRVRKQVPYANSDTLYYYDSQGHLLGESPTGGAVFSKEYVYLGDLPVAVLQ